MAVIFTHPAILWNVQTKHFIGKMMLLRQSFYPLVKSSEFCLFEARELYDSWVHILYEFGSRLDNYIFMSEISRSLVNLLKLGFHLNS